MTIDDVAKLVAAVIGGDVQPFATLIEKDASARSIVVPEATAQDQLRAARRSLPPGYLAFLGEWVTFGRDATGTVELVIVPGTDQFDIVRLAQTDGCNYDVYTDDIVEKLQQLHSGVDIDIVRATGASVEFILLGEPADWSALCDDLYAFCPDMVDQGMGTIEALEREIRATRHVFLWWD